MTIADRFANLSPLKRALLALDEMKARLDAAERQQREPIAIIGLGCRIPGPGCLAVQVCGPCRVARRAFTVLEPNRLVAQCLEARRVFGWIRDLTVLLGE